MRRVFWQTLVVMAVLAATATALSASDRTTVDHQRCVVPEAPPARTESSLEIFGEDPADGVLDSAWSEAFSLPGFDDVVRALVVFRGDLIAAGDFDVAGRRRVGHIARWDGIAWQPLGEGLSGVVYALAVYQDRLIAAGQFMSSDGISVGPVASWDGTAWSSLGPAASGLVVGLEAYALYIDGETLVAGGSFDRMGEVPARRIARWDGSSWSAIGAGFEGTVNTIGVFEGDLIAGGRLVSSGDSSLANVARWDGASWGPVGQDPAMVGATALATFRGELHVAAHDGLRKWNGSAWDVVSGAPLGIMQLMVEGDSLIAVGSLARVGDSLRCVESWNGTRWSPIGRTPWTVGFGVVRHQGQLVMGGWIDAYGPEYAPSQVVRWDGSAWGALEAPEPRDRGLAGFVSSLLPLGDRLLVGGSFRHPAAAGWSSDRISVAAWDGGEWMPMADPPTGQVLAMVSHRGEPVIGGNFFALDPEFIEAIARWDGSQWRPVGPALSGHAQALASDGQTLYAGGAMTVGPATHARVAAFDGSAWRPLGAGQLSWDVTPYALFVHAGQLYMGGHFDDVGLVPALNVARWDGTSWNALGAGVNGTVRAFATLDGDLIVGGDFSRAGDVDAWGLARWDGSTWHAIPGVVASGVGALLVDGADLFVGGSLVLRQIVPGRPVGSSLYGLARYRDGEWASVGSGVNRNAMALARLANSLYVGGDFSEVGGKVTFGFGSLAPMGKASFAIARWDGLEPASSFEPTASLRPPAPNPFTDGGVELAFALNESRRVELSIHDLSGRRVATVVRGVLPGGLHRPRWSGHGTHGGPAPAGVYFARLAIDGLPSSAQRVVLVR